MTEQLKKEGPWEFGEEANQWWSMPWQEMETIFGNSHSVFQRNLNFSSREEARAFLTSCGFDLSNPSSLKLYEQFYYEALFFIRNLLLTPEDKVIFKLPKGLLSLDMPEDLLLFASDLHPRKRYRRIWSCAILKVMYAISNLHFMQKLSFIDSARQEIFKKIKKCLFNSNGRTLIKSRHHQLALSKVEWKEMKTRKSIILKLLQKPDSVGEDVFDYIGVRFIVENPWEIPLLIQALIECHILIPHQVVAMRTKNTLMDLKSAKSAMLFLKEIYSRGTLSQQEFNQLSRAFPWDKCTTPQRNQNFFTHKNYQAVQFTVRHFVKNPNPAYVFLDSFSNRVKRYKGFSTQEAWLDFLIPSDFATYFPIEIQIMDEKSYQMAKFGPASHEQYKASQIKAVREKLLRSLLRFDASALASQEY